MSFLFNNSVRAPRPPASPASNPTANPALNRAERTPSNAERFYRELIEQRPALIDERLKLHARIIDEFNLALLEKISLNQREVELFTNEIFDEMIGFGPIEPLLKDPTVSDILINTHETCFVERFGKLHEAKVRFKDEDHLLRIVNKIVAGVGRRV